MRKKFAGMSRRASCEGASPATLPPEQLCPTSTEIKAAPTAKSSVTATAAAITIKVVRPRVMTGTALNHPSSTRLTSHRVRCSCSVSRTA